MKIIEMRDFKSEEHIDIITSAFQFELNANETLYVEQFRRGAMLGTKKCIDRSATP